MQWKAYVVTALTLIMGVATLARRQKTSKPTLSEIEGVPSGQIVPSGTCNASTQGYLEISHRTNLSSTQIGQLISKFLKKGYVVTIYPPRKRGIFVRMECTNVIPGERP